jgi:hypothetical protein
MEKEVTVTIYDLLAKFRTTFELKTLSLSSEIFPSILNEEESQKIHQWCAEFGCSVTTEEWIDKQKWSIMTIVKSYTKKPTEADMKSLIKDFALPIPISKEPYFSYFVDLYDSFLQTKKKYELLVDAINHPEIGSKTIKSYALTLADRIGNAIKGSPGFETFKDSKLYTAKNGVSKSSDIYVKCKEERVYISIDIRTANFTAMKFFDPLLVLDSDTWNDLIRKFTSIEYFIQSKHFRQIVFGRIGPAMKRINSIQRYLTAELSSKLKDQVVIEHVSDDEIIINSTIEMFEKDMQLCQSIIETLPENMQVWKIIPFSLVQLGKSEAVIKRNLLTNATEIRHINKDLYAQCFRYYNGQDMTPSDLKFTSQHGFLCSFDEHLFI